MSEKVNVDNTVDVIYQAAVRMYRPRKEILDGTWKFPEAQPLS